MFTIFRYGLLPVVVFCIVVIGASFDVYSTNAVRNSTWTQTVATVVESRDFGQQLAESRGTQNTFPDPQGTLKYLIDGKTHIWQGRGRDIGVTAMTPGDKIPIFYNPENPSEISTLVLLGASTGSIILAVAIAFLAFYVWFFWLRGLLRHSGPGDFDDDVAGPFADRMPVSLPGQMEQPRIASADKRSAANEAQVGKPFGKR
jgi:hypothetical protein